ncbi:MAG TPA: OsmC family peroxiredoxin [Gaiellaceae bacterium]|jgi:osmotically inducible protein OsmC|nr:OsmC family peroxiredoxin [Gaiellaceae bacterium]
MPRIERNATVTWEGNVARGAGQITAGTGSFGGIPYSLPSRIGAGDEAKTSPEELLAAAHAGCYAMGLASELTKRGAPPQLLEVRCRVTMDEVEGKGHQIVHSTIDASARADGIDAAAFAEAAEVADEECPFSALIKASAGVTVNAKLEGGT